MASQRLPFIPEYLTVHLGRPDDSSARNIQVSFPEYIKNVASSEIYPTWPENAIRSNIYAQISFALNRVYTEWYRSKGYDFDITNSTQYDQAFVQGREIFENISQIVDEIFNNYVRRQGSIEPYFTQYCNGTTVTCDGLSQWGTVPLAEDGLTPYQILQNYYGNNIDIVRNAPIQSNIPTYPGIPLRQGSARNEVATVQIELNRIGDNYPSIPKIRPINGVFDEQTARAVRQFQRIFSLNQTGVVDKPTWYKLKYIYNSVKQLSELASEGLQLEDVQTPYPPVLREGMSGNAVRTLQYYLNVIAYFNDDLDLVPLDGQFGPETTQAVREFQRVYGLTVDGIVGRNTWNKMIEIYEGILRSLPPGYEGDRAAIYPGYYLTPGEQSQNVRNLQTYLNYLAQSYTFLPPLTPDGIFGPQTTAAVRAFQEVFGLPVTGTVGPITWNAIANEYDQLRTSSQAAPQ